MVLHILKIRRSLDRFITKNEWLDSRHTFSFGKYQNPLWDNFGPIKVINEDLISPNSGLPIHSHKNMEIITLVTEGVLTHKDSLENSGKICKNEVQLISAGEGIFHSEKNESCNECKLFQIWILPKYQNLTPSYHKKNYH